MAKTRIVVVLDLGTVKEVLTDGPSVEVLVKDLDVVQRTHDDPACVYTNLDSKTRRQAVADEFRAAKDQIAAASNG